MRTLLLTLLVTLCVNLPVCAEGLGDGWQGAQWGISQSSAVAIWRGRGWRYKSMLDDGTLVLAGRYAGYNASLFIDPGAFTSVFVAIDSQQGKTSAQIWVDLHEVIERKYGANGALHWRRAGTTQDWQQVDNETDDTEAMSRAFFSADTDVNAQWTQGPIDLQMFTGKLENGNRCVFVRYRHVQGSQRKEHNQERARAEAV